MALSSRFALYFLFIVYYSQHYECVYRVTTCIDHFVVLCCLEFMMSTFMMVGPGELPFISHD